LNLKKIKKRKDSFKSSQKGNWTEEDDALLNKLVKKLGAKNWSMIAGYFPNRIGK
jgi:myb proto-oncogene protein